LRGLSCSRAAGPKRLLFGASTISIFREGGSAGAASCRANRSEPSSSSSFPSPSQGRASPVPFDLDIPPVGRLRSGSPRTGTGAHSSERGCEEGLTPRVGGFDKGRPRRSCRSRDLPGRGGSLFTLAGLAGSVHFSLSLQLLSRARYVGLGQLKDHKEMNT
jgi:hypothetical protein